MIGESTAGVKIVDHGNFLFLFLCLKRNRIDDFNE